MKVTDEELRRLFRKGWIQSAGWAGRDDLLSDMDSNAYMKLEDEAVAYALSHAAGQEARTAEDVKAKLSPSEWAILRNLFQDHHAGNTHPRTCPSGEVEMDAARYRKLKPMLLSADFEPEDYVGLTFALPAGTCVMANLDSIIDGIASSEVKGEGDTK